MAETKTINLDVETNLGSLRTQLRQAQAEVAAMSEKFGATSVEAANAAKKAAELRDRIQDAKALTDAFNPDAKFNALSKSIGGALNGFQAFEGALGVLGVESEDLQKQLLKVQSAMALSQGIQGALEAKDSFIALSSVIKNSVVAAFTTLRGALISTGIGALVVTVGYLVNSFIEASEASKNAAEEQKKYNEQLKKHNELAREANETGVGGNKEKEREIELLKARGATTKQIYDAEIKLINDKIKAEESLRDAGGYEEQQKSIQNIAELRQKAQLLEIEYNNTIKKQREENKKQRELDRQEREKALKEENDLRKKAAEDLAKELEQIEENHNKRWNDITDKQNKKLEKDLQDVYDNQKGLLEAALIDDENNIQAKKDLLTVQMANELENKELTEGEKLAIQKKYAKQIEQVDIDSAEKRKKLENDVTKAKYQMAYDSLALISNITSLFGQQNEKNAKRAFIVDKAAKLASATMAGVEGTIEAYKTAQKSPITAVLPAYPIIQAGLAAAFAATNIAKIASAQFNAGGGGAGGNLSPNAPSGASSGVNAPNLSFSMQGGGSSTAQLLNSVLGQPLKAYVVSSDITSAQMLDAKAIKTSVL